MLRLEKTITSYNTNELISVIGYNKNDSLSIICDHILNNTLFSLYSLEHSSWFVFLKNDI